MRKAFIVITVALLVTTFLPVSIASAHVLKTDGSIGAVLHINPDDNPISGQATDYVFSFQDTTGQFRLSDCLCNITFMKDSTTLTTNPLTTKSEQVSEDTYIFPKPGVYTLRVTGDPKQDGDFHAFNLDYIVRVSGDGTSTHQDFPPLLWLGIGLVMGLILLSTVPAMYADSNDLRRKKK